MSFFKKGDRVLIRFCSVRDYIGLTGTVISYTEDSVDAKGSVRIAIDEKFHKTLRNKHWVTDPSFFLSLIDLVPIGTKILKNE